MSGNRQTQRSDMPLVTLLPNAVTIIALCAGLTAIRMGFNGQFRGAVIMILVACVLDGMDGRLARLLRSESPMGAELDSLADAVNFGVAPALVVYAFAMQDATGAGWIAVLVYAVSCVMRLARFNLDSKSETATPSGGRFVGVPAPAGAFLVLLPLFLSFQAGDPGFVSPVIVGCYMIAVGMLMISRIPTFSFKKTRVARKSVKFLLIGFVFLAAALLTQPWLTLIAFELAYVVSIFWTWYTRESDQAL
ncbi:CDP-diacylglycerol--serine O-phosphatidyltransferase [Sedimentitalea sp. XS_ASV28]|uniref:CDP-diacylglycerol--serine O-phosphatidyltransferase n=1 Tax=Sedimentitalea sp. XS_ASV28 TaxID=3241296 RepID=UPI00351425CC